MSLQGCLLILFLLIESHFAIDLSQFQRCLIFSDLFSNGTNFWSFDKLHIIWYTET